MKTIRAFAAASAVAALLFSSTARADGDVPPDPIICPALYSGVCVPPGICSAECVTYCDGIDSTDASLACKVCIVTSLLVEWDECAAAQPVYVPDCPTDYGYPSCVGDEVPSDCMGDGACDDPLVCMGCCPNPATNGYPVAYCAP